MHCPWWDDAFVSSFTLILYSNHTKYLAQVCGWFFCVLENFRRKFANLVAEPTDGTMKRLVVVKHIQSSNGRWKSRPNRCIIGDAILTQTGKKWPKNAVTNLAVCRGSIWHWIEKLQYRCTTTIPHVHNSSKDVLENLLPVWLLVCTNLFIPNRFWTTYTNFWHFAVSAI